MSINDRQSSVFIIGYGNPGRRDDGLGPALAKRLEAASPAGVEVDIDYQLNIEHAHDLANFDIVIFADAAVNEGEAYYFREIKAGNPTSFSTHSVSPQAVLRLAKDLFDSRTRAYALGITGYEFEEIAEGLTEKASHNLDQATDFISKWLLNRDNAF